MGKSSNVSQQSSNKAVIARDKLSDGDFDKLVTDTSLKVSQKVANHFLFEQLDAATTTREKKCLQEEKDDELNSSSNSSSSLATPASIKLNQPKRPMNAFMVWGQAIRRELHDKFSNVQNALLSKALGRVWRTLDASQKEPYVKKANLIKADHKRDYPNYRYRPRRIQERRLKCNMLIGIQLDHPVNQQPKLGCFSSSSSSSSLKQKPDHHYPFSCNTSSDSSMMTTTGTKFRLANEGHHFVHDQFSNNNNNNNITKITSSGADQVGGQVIDGVQKFEYQPYPYNTVQGASSLHSSRFVVDSKPTAQTTHDCSRNFQVNTVTATATANQPTPSNNINNYNNSAEPHHSQRQDVSLVNTKSHTQTDFSYPQYHSQFYYNMHHHHHQQQQQQQQQHHHQHQQHQQQQHQQHNQYRSPICAATSSHYQCFGENTYNTPSPINNASAFHHQSCTKSTEFEERFL